MALWWLYGGYVFPVMARPQNSDFLSQIGPWKSRSIATQNKRDLNQAISHLWSKFKSYVADKLKMG